MWLALIISFKIFFMSSVFAGHSHLLRKTCLKKHFGGVFNDEIEEFVCKLYKAHFLKFNITEAAEIRYLDYLYNHVWTERISSCIENNVPIFLSEMTRKFHLNGFTLILNSLADLDFNIQRTLLKKLNVPCNIVSIKKLADMVSHNPVEQSGYMLWTFEPNPESIWNLSKMIQRSHKAYWFVMNKTHLNVWNDTFVLPDSNIFTIEKNTDGGVYLHESYKVALSSELRHKPWGLWSLEAGIFELDVHKWDRRGNLQGLHLRAGAMIHPPFYLFEEGSGKPSGLYGEIWDSLHQILHFNYSISLSIDGKWGAIDQNGEWDGLVGMVVRNEIDVISSDMALTHQRSQVMDFTHTILQEDVKIFYRPVITDSFSYTTFTALFRLEVWLTILFLFIALSITFNKLCAYFESRSSDDIGMVFMFPMRMLCCQGSEQDASSLSTRIILIISLAASLIINASYSANLTSFLFNKKISVPFSSLKDLKENTMYNFGTVDGSVYTDTLLAGELSHSRYSSVSTMMDGIRRVRTDPKYAYFSSTSSVYEILSNDTCQVQGVSFSKDYLTIYMRMGNPYTELFSHHIKKISENGQLDKLWNKWRPHIESNCFPKQAQPVGMESIFTGFILLLYLSAMSLVVLIVEVLFHRARNPEQNVATP